MNQYKEKDNRIKVFSRKKEPNELWGYTPTVNIRRGNAVGDYIIIPDSDDYLELDALEKLYNASNNGTIDVIKGAMKTIDKNKNVIFQFQIQYNEVFNSWMALEETSRYQYFIVGVPQLQTFLVKNDLMKSITFAPYMYMDTSTAFKIKMMAKTIRYIPDIIYTSEYREGSITNSGKSWPFEMFKVMDELESFIKQNNIDYSIWNYFHAFKIICYLQPLGTIPINQISLYWQYVHKDIQYSFFDTSILDEKTLNLYNYIKDLDYIL